jgi:flavin-dependent dehydrogenase
MWDVIIVGGGPGGAMVAKKCAEQNLKALLLEKRGLPREKVCTGMLMSPMAQNTIQQEFGKIPEEVLTTPHFLAGIWLHFPGTEDYQISVRIPLTWRRNLDYWLIEKARQSGVHVWEESRVTNVTESPHEYLVKLKQENKETEVRGKFLIGADGAASVVRKCLFPQLKTISTIGYRECYKVDLGLDKNYWHVFFTPEFVPYYFSVIHKGEFMLIDLGTRPKELRKLISQAHHTLAKKYGFELGWQPLWRDACVETVLYRWLFSGSFLPVRGNSLLVGDAAGFILPLSGEGIGTALKSGLLAATSVIEANRNNNQASHLYLDRLKDLLSKMQDLYTYVKKILEPKNENQKSLLLKEAWQKALSLS